MNEKFFLLLTGSELYLFHFYFIVYALDGPTKHRGVKFRIIKENLKEMTQFPPPTRNQ